MKIGIIGAENSHTAAIASIINVQKKIAGCTVDYVWGETDDFAKAAAEKGQIPNIVKSTRDMLGKIDALIVDHRHPKYHLKPARPFIEAGIPTFIDKPFCYRAKEGKEFLRIARQKKTPVTSFSVLTHQRSFARFQTKMESLGDIVSGATYGSADLKSKYGGVFFYGIHQVDMILVAFGYNVRSVRVTKNGPNAIAQLMYPNGKTIVMHMIKQGAPGFGIAAIGANGSAQQPVKMDASPYISGVRTFTKMFKTGKEPLSREQILRPVQVLEALERSVKSGNTERVLK